jgi:hypothetical protein
MLTLLVQVYGKQGNINPTLYNLAKNATTYAKVFHDITTGNNIVPCTTGTTGCVGGEVGFSAETGYDLVTGLGSINGGALYEALATASPATYILAPSTTSVSLAVGGVTSVGFNLTSHDYAGTVSFIPSVTLNGVSTSAITASVPLPVTLASNGTGIAIVTITAGSSAGNHAPSAPWRSGGVVVFAVLLGAPFTLRRKQALAVLLTALAISAAGFLMSCGGGGGSSTQTPSARTYSVTLTPTGSGTVTNPSPMTVTVTVP